MAKLHYIGSEDYLINYSCNSTVAELCEWYNGRDIVQFDTETNVVPSIVDRELRVVQIGNEEGDEVWVLQWSFLSDEDKSLVLRPLSDDKVLKIIHNADFDYQVVLKQGIIMNNVWDTMVMEQILYAGHDMDLRFFSLATVLQRRYYIDISKEQQAEFGDDQINDEKLIYAATDVVHLGRLRKDQRKELIEEDLIQLAEPADPYIVDGVEIPAVTENEVVLAFADMSYNGMGFDPVKWRENIAKAQPIIDKATGDLSEILTQEPYRSLCLDLNVTIKIPDPEEPYNAKKRRSFETRALKDEAQFTVNWNSGPQAVKLLKWVFPDLEKAAVLELKKYLQASDPLAPKTDEKGKGLSAASKKFMPYVETLNPDKFSFIKLAVLKQYDALENMFLANFKDRLISEGYYIPEGKICINWNSHPTKMEVFKWFVPSCETTDADFVADNIHIPFFQAFQQYQFANSLVSKYGEKFILDNVDSDGRVRTRFNTVLSTGRVSSSSPNMQQIPAMKLPEDRQNDYRNCFTPGKDGWSVIGSDYASQELAIIGSLSGDPVFLDALRTGKDLHSTCAELIYGKRWKGAASEGCGYYALDDNGNKLQGKCKCKGHKKLRNGVKTLNFGLAYGMSEIALSADLKITTGAAKTLMDDYFSAFPKIKGLLDAFGMYGRTHGFIRTPKPFARKRYYPYWKGFKETSSFLLGKIDRASKNMPIQGLAADMTKIALCLSRRKIDKFAARDKVQLFMQVHDQLDSLAIDPIREFWAEEVSKDMELAAKICLGNDLLKTDTEISKLWQK